MVSDQALDLVPTTPEESKTRMGEAGGLETVRGDQRPEIDALQRELAGYEQELAALTKEAQEASVALEKLNRALGKETQRCGEEFRLKRNPWTAVIEVQRIGMHYAPMLVELIRREAGRRLTDAEVNKEIALRCAAAETWTATRRELLGHYQVELDKLPLLFKEMASDRFNRAGVRQQYKLFGLLVSGEEAFRKAAQIGAPAYKDLRQGVQRGLPGDGG